MYGNGFAPKNKLHTIGLAINSISEKDKINRGIFNEVAKRLNIGVYENKSKDRNSIQLSINSNIFTKFIRSELFISEKNKEKQFNTKWFSQNIDNLSGILYGLRMSDGSYSEGSRINFDNTSKSIINVYKILCLMTNEGINGMSIRKSRIDKNNYKSKESYKLRLNPNAINSNTESNRIKEDDEYWYLPIRPIKILPKTKTTVYDITVENEHNYLLNNMIVHNSVVSSIISYLLEISQINPLKMPVDMPFYRFITEERAELADIDVDSQSDKREQIFYAVKDYFNSIGGDVVNCCTYTTLSAKAAIQAACRGLKIDTDSAQMMSSMIPIERGFVWSLNDTYYGNEDKNRPPVKEFKNEVDKYEKLLETALLVEDLIINRSIHAAGVFIVNDDFHKFNAIMRSAKLVRTSQWDLHDSEEFYLVKYDLLTTKALTKIRKTLDFLIKDNLIEQGKTLKDTYNNYINPMNMQYDTEKTWELVGNNEIIDLFQFDTDISVDALSKVKPKSMIELAQTNSLMRLQQQPGAIESPTETYARFKNDINEAYKEMDEYKVPKKDQKILEKVLGDFKFVADTQEAIMALVRIPELTNFTVNDSHKLRKAIGKKSETVFEETRVMFYEKGKEYNININTLNYIWEVQVTRQKGYAFSILHCIAYTFIALQELYL